MVSRFSRRAMISEGGRGMAGDGVAGMCSASCARGGEKGK